MISSVDPNDANPHNPLHTISICIISQKALDHFKNDATFTTNI
jgi:hypothetical protein